MRFVSKTKGAIWGQKHYFADWTCFYASPNKAILDDRVITDGHLVTLKHDVWCRRSIWTSGLLLAGSIIISSCSRLRVSRIIHHEELENSCSPTSWPSLVPCRLRLKKVAATVQFSHVPLLRDEAKRYIFNPRSGKCSHRIVTARTDFEIREEVEAGSGWCWGTLWELLLLPPQPPPLLMQKF